MSFSKVYVEKSTKNIESGDIFFYETGYICSDSKGNITYIFAKSLKCLIIINNWHLIFE